MFMGAVLATGLAIVAFTVVLPPSPQHLVGLGCLLLAMVSAIMAMRRYVQDQKEQETELNAVLQRQENLLRYQNDGLQTYLANLESFVKVENEGLRQQLSTMAAETTALTAAFGQFQEDVEGSIARQVEGLAHLEKTDENLGVLLTAFSKSQENFRAKVAATLQALTLDATSHNEQLVTVLSTLNEGLGHNETAFEQLQTIITSLHSLGRDTSSSVVTLRQELEAQSQHQNISYDALTSLLAENRDYLQELDGKVARGFADQRAKGEIVAQELLQAMAQEYAQGREEISQGVIALTEKNAAILTALKSLLDNCDGEFEKQRLATEILAQLLADNGAILTDLQSLSQEGFAAQDKLLRNTSDLLLTIKEENNQELVSQAQVLAALDGKVGSQQKAVLAALRQVEHSHRPQGRLEGDLSNMGLPDLLQILQLAKKTAAIFLKDIDGAIYLENGLLVYVRQGKFAGFQAFIRIMMVIRGYFSVRFDLLPSALPKKPRPLLAELLTVITEVDEIKNCLAALEEKIKRDSKQDNFLVQLPEEGVARDVLATFNYQAPARLEELAVLMGKGVQENIDLLAELHEQGKLTLIS